MFAKFINRQQHRILNFEIKDLNIKLKQLNCEAQRIEEILRNNLPHD